MYKASCGDELCIGGGVGALFANIAVTPLAVYGTGRLAGGDGTLGRSYFGAALAFAPAGPLVPNNPALGLGLGILLMPFMSALGFELSSNSRAKAVLGERAVVAPTASVSPGARGVSAMNLGLRVTL